MVWSGLGLGLVLTGGDGGLVWLGLGLMLTGGDGGLVWLAAQAGLSPRCSKGVFSSAQSTVYFQLHFSFTVLLQPLCAVACSNFCAHAKQS